MRVPIPLLQRYIFGELVRVFVFVVLCLTVLLVFVGVFQQASDSGLGPVQLLQILPYIVPSMLPFTMPAALLLTVSLVYGRLAGDQEVTAAKAAGISVSTLLWPSFIVGAGLSACCLVLTDQAIPWAMANIERTVVSAMEEIIFDSLRTEHRFSSREHGLHVVVGGMDGRRLIHPVFTVQHGERTESLCAEEATIRIDLEQQEVQVHLKNGFIELEDRNREEDESKKGKQRSRRLPRDRGRQDRIFINDPHPYSISWRSGDESQKLRGLPIRLISHELETTSGERSFATDRMQIEAAMALTRGDFSELVSPENKHRKLLRDIEKRTYRMTTEIHSRYALACSCLFFVLVGSPLAVLKAQSRFLTSFLYCFVPIVTGYYPLVLGLMAQSKKGHVDPAWAMWLGNAALACVGLWLMQRVVRR